MKKIAFVCTLLSVLCIRASFAADITIYYAPSCPHCHHARDFISNTLVYEYPELKVTAVDVTVPEHRDLFRTAVEKCGFDSGGVPVIVIGDKCEQGYADYMQQDLRNYVEADLNNQQKAIAAANRQALQQNADGFKKNNSQRENVIVEYAVESATDTNDIADDSSVQPRYNRLFLLGGLLILVVAGLGYALVRKSK